MNKRTRRDINQIAEFEHDEDTNSKKVKIVSTELAIELRADSGDSVQCQSRCESITLSAGEEFDISKYSRAKMYIQVKSGSEKSYVALEISPESSGNFFVATPISLLPSTSVGESQESDEISIMGMRGRISCDNGDKVLLVVKGL